MLYKGKNFSKQMFLYILFPPRFFSNLDFCAQKRSYTSIIFSRLEIGYYNHNFSLFLEIKHHFVYKGSCTSALDI